MEGIINAKPLTYVYPDELIPIRPAKFLPGVQSTETPDIDDINRSSINKRVKYLQKIRDGSRQKFRNEYLANLVQNSQNKRSSEKLQVGDIVLIGSDNMKHVNCGQWEK